ncbi:MAG: DUF1573 domain-containing protein [Pirellulales bacterium]
MKLITAIVLTALTGVGLGYATTLAEFGVERRLPQFDRPTPRTTRSPKAVAEETVHDFGTMYMYHEDEHVFVIRNVGNANLTVKKGRTNCGCTVSELSRSVVAPGETVDVTVQWKTKGRWNKNKWIKTARINTDDPTKPEVVLQIEGFLLPECRFAESSVAFNPVTSHDSAEVEVPLFFYQSPDIEILGFDDLPPDLKDHLEVDFRPMTAEELQSHQDEDELNRGAKRGYVVTTKLKPGLEPKPRGYQHSLTFRTKPQLRQPVQLPVSINVQPDIQIYGIRVPYFPEKKLLNLGTIPVGKGFDGRLNLVLAGDDRHDVEIRVKETVPESLEVTFGSPEELPNKTNRRPMIVKLPESAEPISLLGEADGEMGYVVLETTHPHTPEYRFNVRVAVE